MRPALALFRRAPLKHLIPIGLMGLLLPLLGQRLGSLDADAVKVTLATTSGLQWALALSASGLSFLAVGHYDRVLHRALGTGVAPRRAAWAGIKAVALAQTLGLPTVTGALVRWRALPELDLLQTTRLSDFVGLSFFAAWALVTLCMVALFGAGVPLPQWVVLVAFAAFGLTMVLTRIRTGLPPALIPPLDLCGGAQLLLWTLLDTLFAALALWIFLPSGTDL